MKEQALKKNQLIPLIITAITHEGNGVGRFQGMAVFVPMTAVGDIITARVVKVLSSYAFGIVEELLEPSNQRQENDCPVYAQCGGCALRHMDYGAELAVKSGWITENLRRIGGIDIEVEKILPSVRCDRYRNKAQYPIRMVEGKIQAGFFARRSHRLIPVADCKLQPAFFGEITAALIAFMEEYGVTPYDEVNHTGIVRHLFIRNGEGTGQVMVWLVVNAGELPHWQQLLERLRTICPGLASFGVDINRDRTNVIFGNKLKTLFGADTIADTLCGLTLELSPLSFYQVNRDAAERLFHTALAFADPAKTDLLLDLYCGAGAVGLSMAHAVGQVIGVEVVPQAVENAVNNAERNNITNTRFFCADAAQAVEQLRMEGLQPNIIVLDPPRKGADETVLRCVGELSPAKVIYISCNSATLARDCKLLRKFGYRVSRVGPADLFPRTTNVECCCLLIREEVN